MKTSVRDRVEGILIGLAAGDRNGGPVRMAVRLAESLAEKRFFDPADIGRRYLQWWRDGAFDTGPVTAGVLRLVDDGMAFADAAARIDRETDGFTAGCNPAHRCAPLAMARSLPDEQLHQAARREAELTHCNPVAAETSAAVAVLCRKLVIGRAWPEALQEAGTGLGGQVQAALGTEGAGEQGIKNGGYSPEVLAAAVLFIGRSKTFAAALEQSIAFAGPANYCPVLVGSIGGARWGRSAIPETMLLQCEILDRVESAAERLSSDWKSDSTS